MCELFVRRRKVTCTKPDAAVSQLDVDIGLLFSDGDSLAVRTLAGAAYGILADLAENQKLGSSWRTKIIEDSGLSKKDALRLLNAAQNYLKHADRNAESTLSFDEEENDCLSTGNGKSWSVSDSGIFETLAFENFEMLKAKKPPMSRI